MKALFTGIVLLLGSVATVSAQDYYLPVSSTSKAAVASLHRASELYSNIHFKEGKVELDKALAEDPNFFMAHVYAVQYAPKADRPELIDKALAIDATNFNEAEKIMREWIGKWKADSTAKAGESMNALIAAYPKTPQALEWASLHAFYTDKNLDGALDYAQKLAVISPEYAPNYNILGYLYMEKKETEKAKAAFEQYIKLAPKEANAYDSMGEFYLINKDYAKSAELYDKAAAMGLADAKERADKARAMIK
ncbi:Tetratricopeptide repeat-containing protein [Dyadobacter sp. SG02]|uniref:tetratricopeptide repeat protein n=1 Tax=Dyadobacter sp. SG02 TaxID=1855291 RepID=UPI0008B8E095|nr:tetratricopeptide repeat protein [Dyadobacter sp. SG02]SEJ59696.1 Tetratricopeptide repeat-containing protein [Dyadobacter sp. SG02]